MISSNVHRFLYSLSLQTLNAISITCKIPFNMFNRNRKLQPLKPAVMLPLLLQCTCHVWCKANDNLVSLSRSPDSEKKNMLQYKIQCPMISQTITSTLAYAMLWNKYISLSLFMFYDHLDTFAYTSLMMLCPWALINVQIYPSTDHILVAISTKAQC